MEGGLGGLGGIKGGREGAGVGTSGLKYKNIISHYEIKKYARKRVRKILVLFPFMVIFWTPCSPSFEVFGLLEIL